MCERTSKSKTVTVRRKEYNLKFRLITECLRSLVIKSTYTYKLKMDKTHYTYGIQPGAVAGLAENNLANVVSARSWRISSLLANPIFAKSWFLYYMIAHFTMRTHGVNQEFRFVEGICPHRKGHQIRVFFGKRPRLHHTCAT